jgi:anti-sigma B factor antagonist
VKITEKPQGEVMILNLSGKIMGGEDNDLFHSQIKNLISEGYVDVILNLGKVNWINSTGLGVLVSGYHTLKKNGGQMRICDVSDRIDNILNVTQLKLVFETYDTEAAALASLGHAG